MPNPINEGIMQFYIRKVLERHGIWQAISNGKECASCQTTKNNWFTAVHHRGNHGQIKAGQSDAGVVLEDGGPKKAHRNGSDVDAVSLPGRRQPTHRCCLCCRCDERFPTSPKVRMLSSLSCKALRAKRPMLNSALSKRARQT